MIDVHHPLHGVPLTGSILMMRRAAGSCTGSGVLLDLVLTVAARPHLIFSEPEDVLTLGALIASEMFASPLPVLRLAPEAFAALARAKTGAIGDRTIEAEGLTIPVVPPATAALRPDRWRRAMLDGRKASRCAGHAHHFGHGGAAGAQASWM